MDKTIETPENIDLFNMLLDIEDRQDSIEMVYKICQKILKKKEVDPQEYIDELEEISNHIWEFVE